MAEKTDGNQAVRNLLDVNTQARFYMDETSKISDRGEALKAIHKLWKLHSEMEEMSKPNHPAILDLTRNEILRLKNQFGITTEEELQEDEPENALKSI